jgi:Zn-dependent M16 (insulinase) family peptidase
MISLASLSLSAADVDLSKLKANDSVRGFRVAAVYVNDADQPIGGRFIHAKTGFTVDLLQIQSIPQAFTWVNTILVSDQGEPHTQEHLLLGKGARGRAYSGKQAMSLAGSSAFTLQWRTAYHFNTTAGADTFFDLLYDELDALLHPNYTDEEIRREVRGFGVTENADGTLRLEEKGSVYNEMVSSTAIPFRSLFRTAGHLLYGPRHPLAMNAGGEPSGIRTMKPEDIRKFHKSNYYLANMGTIVALPNNLPIAQALQRIDILLNRLEPEGKKREGHSLEELPKPEMALAGTIAYTEYPHKNEQQPSPMALLWPPTRELNAEEQALAELFFSNVAGDATTNLYKLFIDSKTRKMDIGARTIFGSVDEDPGNAITIAFTDVAPSNFTDEKISAIRSMVVDEIQRIMSLPDGSPELKEFNDRIASRLVQTRRALANFVNTPPGFGQRNVGSAWMNQLLALEKTSGFRKSVTLKPQVAFVQKLLDSDKNFWRDYLAKWKVTGTTPYATATRPSPALAQREDSERVARATAEASRLAQVYGATDVQEAIKRYRAEYDAESARIEEEAKKVTPPSFVKSPPMTLDDQIQYETKKVDDRVPVVATRFENMTSGTVGLALRVDGIPRPHLRYVSLLPELLTRVGVIENGRPVSYEEMSERLRKEILFLNANYATNPRTERVELVVRGGGLGPDELRRAIHWMTLALHSPDWRPENLPRIRDVVDQSLGQFRNRMQGPEEQWVNDPAAAYRMQRNAAYLATDSFLTRGHNALRLKWLLRDANDETVAFLNGLLESGKGKSRAELKALLSAKATNPLATEAMKDLDLALIDIPDNSLAADWAYIVTAIRDDLVTPPSEALAALDALRRQILNAANARMFTVGSTAMEKSTAPEVSALAAKLNKDAPSRVAAGSPPLIDDRLRQRDPSATNPRFVGLFSSTKTGGVIITSVPFVHYSEHANKEKQLDYLASRLHAGRGAHGIFLKTLAVGLAYSNGLRSSVGSGRGGYYAERTPELPQTVRFVINELKNAPRDTTLADYTIAVTFDESRASQTYEARAESMANDLADNQPPEMVRRFRQSILELRADPTLGAKLFDRKDRVYARILPGYTPKASDVPGAVHLVIGPDKQLDAWEAYLKATEGADTKLYRLYARDYWMP